MMGSLNLQLGAQPAILRDMKVRLVNQATQEKREVSPFLDGSVMVSNLAPGDWQMAVLHPNILAEIVNRPIRVLPDRPTITRIPIPARLFDTIAVADTADADLGPPQAKLAEADAAARDQARKVAGQPIFADDWNELAATVADTAKATGDLARLVSPIGHDHPEIAAAITDVQENVQKFYDLFARSLAELQRQIEQLALERKVETLGEVVPTLPPPAKRRMEGLLDDLKRGYQDPPAVYDLKKRRFGEALQEEVSAALVTASAEVAANSGVKDALNVADVLVSGTRATSYTAELGQRQRTENKSANGMVFDALRATRGRI
jgi:hypothetical protein